MAKEQASIMKLYATSDPEKLAAALIEGPMGKKVTPADSSAQKLRMVFVASECTPWSKTGGLGDVVRDLPVNLVSMGHTVMSIVPRYDQYEDAWDTAVSTTVRVNNKDEVVRFFHAKVKGVDRVFIDHPWFLEKVWGKTTGKLYGHKVGVDYPDNPLRFSLLAQAALAAPLLIPLLDGKPYGEDVLFVPNDWHTALLGVYMKAHYQPKSIYTQAKIAFILHNIVYQGRFPYEFFSRINIPKEFEKDLLFFSGFCPPPLDGVSDEPIISKTPVKMINFLQAGFAASDLLFTVSPGFSEEVKSGPKKGVELEAIPKKKEMIGILNGADVDTWDPKKDKLIPFPFSAEDIEKRALNKAALQELMGLTVSPTSPVISFVGRLEDQKGYDCILEAIPYIVTELKAQIILMGQGKEVNMQKLVNLETAYPGSAKGVIQITPKVEHLMMAGSDYILMPSRFEPCGLVQLHGMRYGAVPIVSKTGGLKDSVPSECGYQFEEVPSPDYPGMKVTKELLAIGTKIVKAGVEEALADYGTEKFLEQQKTCMLKDFGWSKKVLLYERYFVDLMNEKPTPPVGA
mmetsp:Transcript_24897/g.40993  ORF Transcript_24897/g.40993 Transcript_24897/m.40993 type:complete len:571 (-) Transcript_24897:117-1829(-)|eukprot:CAMPEP_0184661726 /NCGR_PEP_ID=MMETSP0308-20130426/39821_1 /TAXON_ID=38269 /ORGANISM="Gloeochaete witrockiana, Strain SAG 46.84" /LENGTH=570 /DNA_ID=CAMNT_0027103237 /DNA_START=50 /DNA_END=1762 /DNA_ORIENTATION=-